MRGLADLDRPAGDRLRRVREPGGGRKENVRDRHDLPSLQESSSPHDYNLGVGSGGLGWPLGDRNDPDGFIHMHLGEGVPRYERFLFYMVEHAEKGLLNCWRIIPLRHPGFDIEVSMRLSIVPETKRWIARIEKSTLPAARVPMRLQSMGCERRGEAWMITTIADLPRTARCGLVLASGWRPSWPSASAFGAGSEGEHRP
jgi:hypothetical protein